MEVILHRVTLVYGAFVLCYFFVLHGTYLVLTALSFKYLRETIHHHEALKEELDWEEDEVPSITVLVPAYNEEAAITASVRSLLGLDYPDLRVIVINDGSGDDTLGVLQESFKLSPLGQNALSDLSSQPVRAMYRSELDHRLWVVDKENGGKADALNAGLNQTSSDLYCAVDADTILESDALRSGVLPFIQDPETLAVGGVIRVVNGASVQGGRVVSANLPASLLARFQIVEYLRAFLAGRMGMSALCCSLVISGAFGLFRTREVVEAGGYETESVAEDVELVVRLHHRYTRYGKSCRIRFIPERVAWTEVPESLGALARQRDRWHRGLADSLFRHIGMLFNPRHGRIGFFAFPFYLFLEGCAPAVEASGYFLLALLVVSGSAPLWYVAGFLLLAVVMGILLSTSAVVLEELTLKRYERVFDRTRLFFLAAIENLGYRQFTVAWRLRGFFFYLLGRRHWGEQERKGLGG